MKTNKNLNIPNPDSVFPNDYRTTCFIKNVIKATNIQIGDYTYYDDDENDPTKFEENNILYNWPEFGDKLIIGKFCTIAKDTKFIMGPANHRIDSVTPYPFNVFGGAWAYNTNPHLSELPFKGDTIIGNDVWIGRQCLIMPGVNIGTGSMIASGSVVTSNIPPYTIAGGNPVKALKKRFDDDLVNLLLKLKWWDSAPDDLVELLPLLCNPNLDYVKKEIKKLI